MALTSCAVEWGYLMTQPTWEYWQLITDAKWSHCMKPLPRLAYSAYFWQSHYNGTIHVPLFAVCNTVVSIKTCIWHRDGWHGNRPVGVGTEGKPMDTGRVTFQLKRTPYVLEVATLVEANFPHLNIRRKPWQLHADTSHIIWERHSDMNIFHIYVHYSFLFCQAPVV